MYNLPHEEILEFFLKLFEFIIVKSDYEVVLSVDDIKKLQIIFVHQEIHEIQGNLFYRWIAKPLPSPPSSQQKKKE